MADYTATVLWERGETEPFTDNRYARGHEWSFDGGVSVRASSSPHVVPRFSDPAGVDPEEAFIASLSSCHMLTFLYHAAKKGFVVDRYEDTAKGIMGKNEKGQFWVSAVTLRPNIVFSGAKQPTAEELDHLHHTAHQECFIANSVKTDVKVASPGAA
jgi:organic hydroperoxide reductase OsmC/OhrA